MKEFKSGISVRHPRFGLGRVELDKQETVLVRFDEVIHECSKADLEVIVGPEEAISQGILHPLAEVVLRMQAELIRSINDAWGVFSPSRIALLPHQLWVCRKVLETWPTRWLIADDVGLGKTIEAGIILWPLISRRIVRRLLIVCPASLVMQWQYRLRTMFDIRVTPYFAEMDQPKMDFWNTQHMVVASLQTVRADNLGRHERILDAESWDLLIVDEAHHLNYDEKGGMTLGYSIVKDLVKNNKVNSILFFTGTPHRGKTFGFFSLMGLLREDLFDPTVSAREQYGRLPYAMIRNNKQNVTDLNGNLLFKEPLVNSVQYSYSIEEKDFYDMMTEFIKSGKAYASTLGSANRRAVMLVLISLQKLASSSIAAIKKSLEGRVQRLEEQAARIKELIETSEQRKLAALATAADQTEEDTAAPAVEELAKLQIVLMKDEVVRLKELIEAAKRVKTETKIESIIDLVSKMPEKQAVLFFTEYKATQALLMSALMANFGETCVTFINGDEAIAGVEIKQGEIRRLTEKREDASDMFNSGQVRFLVSTEAAGEGIDLQENCYHLVHVDMPWNPMRMHQRVGRLNRYGQTQQVKVVILNNPDTVESRIWQILNEKIENIMRVLGAVMEDPEDLKQLVLGMASPGLMDEIFFESEDVHKESLKEWFDKKTAQMGGQDALELVKELVGNAQKFDFQSASKIIPKVDLPDLKPFFNLSLQWNRRQVKQDETGLSFKTPEKWLGQFGIMPTYSGVRFERTKSNRNDKVQVLGVGHKLLDAAIEQALGLTSSVSVFPKTAMEHPLYIYKIEDRLTGKPSQIKRMIIGIAWKDEIPFLLKDWEVLETLNKIVEKPAVTLKATWHANLSPFQKLVPLGKDYIESHLQKFDIPFDKPYVELLGVLGIVGDASA